MGNRTGVQRDEVIYPKSPTCERQIGLSSAQKNRARKGDPTEQRWQEKVTWEFEVLATWAEEVALGRVNGAGSLRCLVGTAGLVGTKHM